VSLIDRAPSAAPPASPVDASIDGMWSAAQQTACRALGAFLLRQRWYSAKDAGLPTVRAATLVPFPCRNLAAAVAVWEVTPPDRPAMRLLVPLALLPKASLQKERVEPIAFLSGKDGDYALADAFSSDTFVCAWVGFLLQGSLAELQHLRSGRTERAQRQEVAPGGNWSVRRLGIEQSNTSIRIGAGAMLKVFRRLEDGVHPELEVARYLTEAGFRGMPALLGWIEGTGAAGVPSATLSVMHEFVPNQGDGWQWVVQQLTRAAGEVDPDAFAVVTGWVHALAGRTAQMHKAFATPTSDPGFKPEPVSQGDLLRWKADARAMASRACQCLTALRSQGDDADRVLAKQLLQRQTLLEERLGDLEKHRPRFDRTRHHGDFHLGQVLVVGSDALIVDFEGEPLRPLQQRRAKHAVLRDVAGMLRSFSYATEAAKRALPAHLTGPTRQAAHKRLNDWEAEAGLAFVDAYLSACDGLSSLPADPVEAQRVLRFFLLEKALYEIVYEATNRPDWVAIPVRGVLELLDQKGAEVRSTHGGPFGAEIQPDGRVRFRLWAPSHASVSLELDDAVEGIPMQTREGGWHELITPQARVGSLYRYRLPDGTLVPDPASRFQPQDVHGPSEVIDPGGYLWKDGGWRGRRWEEAVVYELHIGAFTPDGTFRSAIDRLDHLARLGVTALEIMPIADFPGGRNWGYDGVSLYAPDAAYGRPEELKELIDAAHGRGLMVLLDVVYNHFGPEGAYIHTIAPEAFSARHKTPWGAAINTDGQAAQPIREFFIHNALYWLEEFHFDGLRLDAVHAILDESPKHLLEELAERVREAMWGRHIHLVLENEENEASRLVRADDGQPRWYSAQWNDDVHHVLHVAATGEVAGYYGDYHRDAIKLGRALAEGFAFQGELMPYRGRLRGERSKGLPPAAFVAFVQNHDQIGNRAFGERITHIAPAAAVRAIVAVYLLLPQIPMLFMGEEWAAAQPFPFFCDFEPALAEAVRKGRRAEFARFPEFQDPARRERIPDPTAAGTFLSAKLAWDDLEREPHSSWLSWYQRLLAVRHRELVPRMGQIREGGRFQSVGENAVVVRWSAGEAEWILEANLSDTPVEGFAAAGGRVLWREGQLGADGLFGPHTVRWSLVEVMHA
jgi:malto-oligosyltrehalose trehalohydrolase